MKIRYKKGTKDAGSKQVKSVIKYKKSFKPNGRLKFILVFLLLSMGLVLFALSPVNAVNQIEVVGNQHYQSQDIIMATQIIKGVNWFRQKGFQIKDLNPFDNKKEEALIVKRCPYVEKASIKYRIGGKVRIELKERIAVGVVPYMGANVVIDKNGVVLESVNQVNSLKIPVIKGFKIEHFEVGEKLNVQNKECMEAFRKVSDIIAVSDKEASSSTKVILPLIKFMDFSDLSKVQIQVDARINVNLGDSREIDMYRINFLKQIYFTTIEKNVRGTLDLSTGSRPHFESEK